MEGQFRRLALDALFPRHCLGCACEGTLWCPSCEGTWWPVSLPDACPFCGCRGSLHTCLTCRKETYLDGLAAFALYANPVVRGAIGQWKYVSDSSAASVIRGWLTRAVPRFADLFVDCAFVPVPLHIRKRRARGFDQAGLLADWLSGLTDRPAFDLLLRVGMSPPQALRAKAARRLGELDRLFTLHPHASWMPRHVVLCDDVFTSGATMDAAARVLKKAGVERVFGFVLAKGS